MGRIVDDQLHAFKDLDRRSLASRSRSIIMQKDRAGICMASLDHKKNASHLDWVVYSLERPWVDESAGKLESGFLFQ